MKSKDLQARLLYSANLSFKIKGQIKSFPDKKNLKDFMTTNPDYMKCERVLFKKKDKRIKNMNNKMALNT